MNNRPIGVFDSSVGGISVLREMTRMLPDEFFLYYGDALNAPYGVRDEDDIRALTEAAVENLLNRNIKALVIACNTATSAAAASLRSRLDIPVIGMEPALKPAAEHHNGGRILVMATPATLRQRKFQNLLEQYGEDAEMVPCGGLMEFVERGELDSPALYEYLHEKLRVEDGAIEAIVLGCTHYVFLKDAIQTVQPSVALYDGNEGTGHQLIKMLKKHDALAEPGRSGGIELCTSGDSEKLLPVMEMLFNI